MPRSWRPLIFLISAALALLWTPLPTGAVPAAPAASTLADSSAGLAASTLADVPLHLVTRTLSNGLQVAVVRNPSVPLATVEIGVHNGSMNEPPVLNGLSHLYEHMFFRGNAVIADQLAYLQQLRALGASWNGTTDTERVNYFFTVGADKIEDAMKFMSDAIKTPRFDADELTREKEVVLGEFDRNEADPAYHFEHAMTRALFYAHPTYKDPLGMRASIKAATVAQMQWMQQVYYIPNNSILVVTGDVDPEKVMATAERCFGDWKAGPDPFIAHPMVSHPPLPASRLVIVTQPVEMVRVRLDWQGPSMGEDTHNAVVADVFSFAVNQDGSRLQRAMVDSGLASEANVSYRTLRNKGTISLTLETTPALAQRAIEAALKEAKRFGDPAYLTPRQWKNAQTLLAVSDLYDRERASEFAHTLTFWFSVDSLQGYRDYIPSIRRATRDDGAAYAARYIVSQPLVLGVMASAATQRAHRLEPKPLDKRLKALWPALPAPAASRAPQPPASAPPVAMASSKQAATSTTPPPSATGEAVMGVPEVTSFEVAGIPVLLRRNRSAPVVAVATFFRGGSLALTPRTQGIEALALATATGGATRGMSRVARSQALDGMGTVLSYDTASDYSRMDMKCVAPFFARSFDVYARGICEPCFAADDVALARRQQLQEIRQEREDPDEEVRRSCEVFFFQGHPYALRPIGTEKTVARLTRSEVAAWFARMAVPTHMQIVVVGNVDRETVTRAIRARLGPLAQRTVNLGPALRAASPPALAHRESRLQCVKRPLPTTYIRGMMATVSPASALYPTVYLTAEILSSRLFEELRTRRNMTYSVWAGLSGRRTNYGVLYVSTTQPNEAIRRMRDCLRALAMEPLAARELQGHIATLVTNYLLGIETCEDQADQMGHMEIAAGSWRKAFTFVEQVREVDVASVQRAARALASTPIQWSVLGDVQRLDRRAFTAAPGK